MRWILIALVVLVLVAGAILISRAKKPGTLTVASPTPTGIITTTSIYPFTSPIPTTIPSYTYTNNKVTTLPQTGVTDNIILGTLITAVIGTVLVKRFKLL